MTIATLIQHSAELWLAVGLLGSLLEALGEWRKLPWLVAFGQRLEAASIDLPKLLRGSRKTAEDKAPKSVGPAVLLLALCLPPSLTSCSPAMAQTVATVVSKVVSEVLLRAQQSSDVIDMVEAQVDAAAPRIPPELLAKIRTGIAACRAANAAAVAASRGAELTAAQANSNFKDFREEWKRLVELLSQLGMASPDGKMRAAPGSVAIPEPLAAQPFEES